MEPINLNNYESVFLDYFEGKLTPQEVGELNLFLEKHPELKEEFESFENIALPEENEPASFQGKESLKKALVNEANYEEYFIASAEGILDRQETEALELFLLSHPELAADYALFEKTKLVSEKEVVFGAKAGLKKNTMQGLIVSDETMAAAMEGMLDPENRNAFDKTLSSDDALQKEYASFLKTVLIPDSEIVYPFKEKLKRRKNRIIWLPGYTYIAAAASLAILFMIWFFNHQPAAEKIVPGMANHLSTPQKEQMKQGEEKTQDKNLALSTAPVIIKKDLNSKQRPAFQKKAPQKFNDIVATPENQMEKENKNSGMSYFPAAALPGNLRQNVLNSEKDGAPRFALISVSQNNLPDDEPQSKERQDEFMNIRQYAADKLQEQLTDGILGSGKKKHVGWGLAKTAVRAFNRVSGRKIRIKENYDDHGELVSYAINGGGFEYARALKK